MKLTEEQKAILATNENIRINAVAGSGKTTTMIEYAASRPQSARILYLVFNKSVKLEAKRKFAARGLSNVTVETAHSLAYRRIIPGSNYTIRVNGYKTHELADIIGISGTGEKHAEYILANHVNRYAAYYCNSNKQKLGDLNYLDIVNDPKAAAFAKTHAQLIYKYTRFFLTQMGEGKMEITHDFYLKKFQLQLPRMLYDYILFDEGQDASPAMLDVFFNQPAIKVIVGDTHQQIYGWRYAVNSLEQAEYPTYNLSESFRFPQEIANLGMGILELKNQLGKSIQVKITGRGIGESKVSRAVIARTNLGLLLKAIEFSTENKFKKIYFEGNINSYTYADDGASLYDVLNLSKNKHLQIRDRLIRSMRNMQELQEYIDKTEDRQLGMLVEIVKEYGDSIYGLIKDLKQKHVGDENKHDAEIVFSTVHRSKGMEYDIVELANDFISETKLEKNKKENPEKLVEEINLLYVAATRAKSELIIPFELVPKWVNPAACITVKIPAELAMQEEIYEQLPSSSATFNPQPLKKYNVAEMRNTLKDAYKPWTDALDEELTIAFCKGHTVKDMAEIFGRTRGAIISRIKKLELAEKYS